MQNNSNTKERILDIAELLIMSKGYNWFSYKNISEELNIKNAAIHYHFPSKKDLGVAVIQRAQARFRESYEFPATIERSPLDILNLSIEEYTGYLNSDNTLCLGSSLESDFHTFPDEMQKEVRIYISEILKWTSNLLSIGRRKGVFTFSGSSEDKAFFLLASLQGALQIAKVSNKDFFYSAIDKIKSDIGI